MMVLTGLVWVLVVMMHLRMVVALDCVRPA
jgi:hypothetical protein